MVRYLLLFIMLSSSPVLLLQVFVALIIACQTSALAAANNGKPSFIRRIRSTVAPFSIQWYDEGLNFNCTGCGKCCMVDGDVWLAPEEVKQIMMHLGYNDCDKESVNDFRKKVCLQYTFSYIFEY